MKCHHRLKRHSVFTDDAKNLKVEIFNCEKRNHCTAKDHGLPYINGLMPVCDTCEFRPKPKTTGQVFDRVVVLNLERRPDRLESLRQQFAKGWPFAPPIIQKSIDGRRVEAPAGFTEGAFAWGCFQSHRRAIEDAINDGCDSVLILEDDATFVDGFAEKAVEWLDRLPEDWEMVFFGGRHHLPPVRIADGILKATSLQFLGCYGVRGDALLELYRFWNQWHTTHCDVAAAEWFGSRQTYCPDPFLVGHAGGWSDITLIDKERNFFEPGKVEEGRRINLPCIHRGPQIDTDDKPPCHGGPQPIFSCEIHGRCALTKYCTMQKDRACSRCGDRQEQ